MNVDIRPDGLPLRDRLRIWIANTALRGLSVPGKIRLRWHLLGERAR